MRVLHVNATSHIGGAARAMQRLHTALKNQGHESKFLVSRSRFPEDPAVHLIWNEIKSIQSFSDRVKSRIGNQIEKWIGFHPWSNTATLRIHQTPLIAWADVIDLRNLFGGFINLGMLPELSREKTLVWRMPDLWAATGHCAYPYDCERWITGCYDCPLLTTAGRKKVEPPATVLDGSNWVWKNKQDIYARSRIHIIVTTEWMRSQVSKSILKNALSIHVISNGVNLNIFKPAERDIARRKLDLPPDKKILLWAAGGLGNYRKGYHLAVKAMETIQAEVDPPPLFLTMAGEEGWDKPDQLKDVRHLGYIKEAEKQALVYSAADGFICSTLADGQPQTALESIACGTPVIAFDLGPMPELVIPGKTGYLAGQPTAEALQETIQDVLADEPNQAKLHENCRQKALREFDLDEQTRKYIEVYQELFAQK